MIDDTVDLIETTTGMADIYLEHAIRDIDKRLGEGYAKQHPELIGAYMRTAIADTHCIIIGRSLDDAAKEISKGIEYLAHCLGHKIEGAANLLGDELYGVIKEE